MMSLTIIVTKGIGAMARPGPPRPGTGPGAAAPRADGGAGAAGGAAAVADWPAPGGGGDGPAPRGAVPRAPAMPGVIPPSSITTIIGTAFFWAIRLSRM